MRDHPNHGTHILGGMFGIRQESNLTKELRKTEFIEMIQQFGSRNFVTIKQSCLYFFLVNSGPKFLHYFGQLKELALLFCWLNLLRLIHITAFSTCICGRRLSFCREIKNILSLCCCSPLWKMQTAELSVNQPLNFYKPPMFYLYQNNKCLPHIGIIGPPH